MPNYKTDAEFISLLARELRITPDETDDFLKAFSKCLKTVLAINGWTNIRGFGVWEVKQRRGGKGRNIRTGEEVDIPIMMTIKFKAAHSLKQIVNERIRRVRKERLSI